MASNDEESQLRAAALKNVESILIARQSAERALQEANQRLEQQAAELREQREWFAVTLSSIGDAVITTDTAGLVTFLNPVAETMTGWRLTEARGQALADIFRIVNELTGQVAENPVAKALLTGEIVALANHTALIRRDGTTVAIEDSAAPIRDAKGKISGVVMVFHDVSVRRAAEMALRDTRARLDATLGAAEIGTWTWDIQKNRVIADRNLAHMFGVTPEIAAGAPMEAFIGAIHPDDRQRVEATVKAALESSPGRYEAEYRLNRADGSFRWIVARGKTQFDEAGVPTHLPGVALDITERKQAEELRSRLAAVVESSDDAILSKNLDGIIITWNRGAERMFGYSPIEVIGRPVTVLIPPEHINEEPDILRRLRRGERIDHYETVRVRKDGTRIAVSLTVSPIRDGNGTVIGASKIARDITEKQHAEAIQRELYESAQREIKQRESAEAALREVDRRKDEFLATLAHELRNPLAPIRQAALISKAVAATEDQKRWSHDVINRQVHHMALLLDDLLDISRVTRGILELRLEMTDLGSIIETAIETARPLIEGKRHSLTVELPKEPIRFAADPLRLSQVLSNLLTNAAKYTDPQGQIRLGASDTADTITIRVSDNGIGIPRDALEEVFAMFSQVKSAQDRSEGGLGIGLAFTKGLVGLHRGTIEVQSAGTGRGSEFIVKLPRQVLSATPTDLPAPAPKTKSARRRVLIADDNRDAAESLAMLLRMDGHDVTVVHDGRQALATIEAVRPEVAVLDIGMPELNGYEVARGVRQHPDGQVITLIAVTGWGQASDKARAAAAGFNHHFTKPIEPDTLSQLLRAEA